MAVNKKVSAANVVHMDANFDAEADITDYVRRLWSNFGGVNDVILIGFTYFTYFIFYCVAAL